MSRVTTPVKGKTAATPPAKQVPAAPMPHEQIAMRAYEKWCQRGCPHGSDQLDWYEAERELSSENQRAARRPQ
jgi:hypothetical protein